MTRITTISLPRTVNFDAQNRAVEWEPSMETNGFVANIQTDYAFDTLDQADQWGMTHQPDDARIHLGIDMRGLVTMVLRS